MSETSLSIRRLVFTYVILRFYFFVISNSYLYNIYAYFFKAKYHQFGFTNDLVLVKLSDGLEFNSNVSAICLPEKEVEGNETCIVAGWGVTKPGGNNHEMIFYFNISTEKFSETHSQYLNYLPVPTIETEECNSSKHYNGQLSSDKICAGYVGEEQTPCHVSERNKSKQSNIKIVCFRTTRELL